MAGLGETCTHVGTVLLYMEAGSTVHGSTVLLSAIKILHVSGTLSRCGTKLATLYSPSYVSKRLLGTLPQPLPLLSKSSYLDLEYHELLKARESVKAEVAEGMAIAVEKKKQTSSQL